MKGTKTRIAVALVHWPILNKAGEEICTNVTNFDIHDISRACRTYGIEKYYIINRMQEQLMFVSRVLDHWQVGEGSKLNPMRQTALGIVETAESLEEAIERFDPKTQLIGTAARDLRSPSEIGFLELRNRLHGSKGEDSYMLVFGTGFGLSQTVLERCEYILEPIEGASQDRYRHLSVRSAVSICLDRLLGTW